MTATGARVSELLQIKAEHITAGHLDIYTKGGKIRRLYIPQILKNRSCRLASVKRDFERIYISQSLR